MLKFCPILCLSLSISLAISAQALPLKSIPINQIFEPIYGLGTGAGTLIHYASDTSGANQIVPEVTLVFTGGTPGIFGCTGNIISTVPITTGSIAFALGASVHLNATSIGALAPDGATCLMISASSNGNDSRVTYFLIPPANAFPSFNIACSGSDPRLCTTTDSALTVTSG